MRRSEAGKLVSRCDYLTAADKSVFRTLLERANNDDCRVYTKYTPTVPQLIQATSLHRATVYRAMDHLVKHKWVVRTSGKGRGHKSSYALVVEQPDTVCQCQKVALPQPKRSQGATERVALPPELSQVKPAFGTRTAEEKKEEIQLLRKRGCEDLRIGGGHDCLDQPLPRCQLCSIHPTYWRTAS